MAKGIIVVDVPEKCDGCEMCGTLLGKVCCIANIRKIKDINAKPEWCPIKLMPEKPDYPPISDSSFVAGWNACLEKIQEGSD